MSTATHDHHPPDGQPVAVPPIDVAPVRRVALIAAIAGLAAFLVLGFINLGTARAGVQDFFFGYLSGWVVTAFMPFGAMALMMIAYLTQASWGLVLRRCFQAATRTLPVVALLFLPVAASLFVTTGRGPASPYWWADPAWGAVSDARRDDPHVREVADRHERAGWDRSLAESAAGTGLRPEAVEEAREKIHDYLNKPFFLVRFVLIFASLGAFIYFLNKWARPAEDADDERAKYNLHAISGPGIIAWGLILTFGITDWVMSVEPTWASSMFPVVFGMDAFVSAYSLSVLTFYALNAGRTDVLEIVKYKFRIDMGTLLFGFTMVWAYASFCQYMLIWAGDLPEEIAYYKKRGNAGWEYLAYFLMAFHWLVPFVVFLFREIKTNPRAMQWMAGMLLTVCALDVIWWLLPAVPRPEGWLHVPMAVAAVVGVGGLWGLEFARQLGQRPILPANSETRFLAEWGHGH